MRHAETAFVRLSLNGDVVPHLLYHSFDFPLLAEHHVVQMFDPLPEVCRFVLQTFGSK